MAFNINRFRDNIASYGYAKPNKFEVFIQSPPLFNNSTLNVDGRETNINDLNNLHRYRIEQVQVPGVSLMSTDLNRYGIGPTQKMPFGAQYYDVTFSVLLDRNTDMWDFWYNWTNAIFNFNGQEPNGNNLVSGSRIPRYTTRYKEDYATTMMIVMYNAIGERIKTINLYDAWPSSIRDLPLQWNDDRSLIRLLVGITFYSYTVVGSDVSSNNTEAPNSSTFTGSSQITVNV